VIRQRHVSNSLLFRLASSVVGVAAIASVAASIALTDPSGPAFPDSSSDAVQYAPLGTPALPATFTGKTPTEILSIAKASYGGSAVDAVGVGAVPQAVYTDDTTAPVPEKFVNGRWARLSVRAPATDGSHVEPEWEAYILAGAARELMHEAAAGDLVGMDVILRLPGGKEISQDFVAGDIAFGQQYVSGTNDDVIAAVRQSASEAGLKILSVRVLHPMGPAPVVIAETADPAEFVRNAGTLSARLFRRGGIPYEGYYLEVRDATSKSADPLLIHAEALRLGLGMGGFREDLGQNRDVSSYLSGSSTTVTSRPAG
jgi:hypothetical protein